MRYPLKSDDCFGEDAFGDIKIPLNRTDVPVESAYLHTFQALIENSTKYVCASAANKVDAKGLIAMASEIAGGEEELVKRPILIGLPGQSLVFDS